MSAAHANGIADHPGSGNGASPRAETAIALDAAQRPEVAVGAAFVGGFLLALLLRRVRS